jgi:hypothetical protein
VRVREVDGAILYSVDGATRGEPALRVRESPSQPQRVLPHQMRMPHPSMGLSAAAQHAPAVDEASRAVSALAHSNFPAQRAQAFVNGVAHEPPPGASSLPSLPPGAAPQAPPPPFAGHCAHFAAAYPPPPAASACPAAGGSAPQLAAARLVGGAPRAPPPTAARFAFHAAAAAAAAAAAPGASAPPAFHDKLHESFHEKLQRVKHQLLVDPSLPVSSKWVSDVTAVS